MCPECPDPPFMTTEQAFLYIGTCLLVYVLDALCARVLMRIGEGLVRHRNFGNAYFLRILMGIALLRFCDLVLQCHFTSSWAKNRSKSSHSWGLNPGPLLDA